MKNGKLNSSPQAEQAIQQVLQAERDADRLPPTPNHSCDDPGL